MALATQHLGEWRRQAAEEVGLPFSRVRVLRRLADGPLTLKALADVASMDAPAATVAVNDLEAHGLVARVVDPANRRAKIVDLTPSGRAALGRVDRLRPPAPPEIAALGDDDLEALAGILSRASRFGRPAAVRRMGMGVGVGTGIGADTDTDTDADTDTGTNTRSAAQPGDVVRQMG
ncbi:MarR family transcriptional regulator [Subtercola vilae]|uniref:MarR family transcriptional regulator n=2 Tax=Microbacteriaceae TaxID=85023 RepID=A0A4T2CCP1_9MICO|nr:MarR family transcriptional regulator [Subtercola vilae]